MKIKQKLGKCSFGNGRCIRGNHSIWTTEDLEVIVYKAIDFIFMSVFWHSHGIIKCYFLQEQEKYLN